MGAAAPQPLCSGVPALQVIVNGLPSVRELYQEQEFFNSTIKILMSSWRSSTTNQFDTHVSPCVEVCKTNSYDSTCID